VAVGIDDGRGLIEASDLTTKPLVPWVTGLNPGSGPLGGDDRVTISGAYLTGTTRVLFGANAATHLHVISAWKLTATAPSHLAGIVHVLVTTRGGTSLSSASSRYSYDNFQFSASDMTLRATQGKRFSATLTVLGSSVGATIAWAKAGPLPASLTLTPRGVLSGTPSKVGTFTVGVIATEELGHISTRITGKLNLIVS
jgi:hypothetical protein